MKRILKKLSSLLLVLAFVLALMVGMATVSFAEDSAVIYKGLTEGFEFLPGSGYTDSDLFDEFKGAMPGDTLTEVINVRNEATDCDYIELFIRARAHDEVYNPLSDGVAASGETVATMSDFLAQLSMRIYNGGQLIYEASPDELDGLAENVFLGTFRSGDSTSLRVELDVPIDLGNEYANRVGEVDWIFYVEAFDDPVPPPPDDTTITVHKLWSGDDSNRPESIIVYLMRDGQFYAEAELNAGNQWTFTWTDLDADYDWMVIEAEVPENYNVDYEVVGDIVYIINSYEAPPTPTPTPTPTPETPVPETPVPVTPVPETPVPVTPVPETPVPVTPVPETPVPVTPVPETPVPVTPVPETPVPVTPVPETPVPVTPVPETPVPVTPVPETPVPVTPVPVTPVPETPVPVTPVPETPVPVTPVPETPVPETPVPPTETPEEPTPTPTVPPVLEVIELTVVKEWAGDEDSLENRPESVSVTLYNGTEPVETVWLGDWNNWRYTWDDLPADGDWNVIENVPRGYTPSYRAVGSVVTITNTASLIQTGQVKWPIPVLLGVGALMLVFGGVMILKKRKNDHA